ncbi:probable receptor-like protein kinase At5g38990 [Phaseolus vulgaris]|uniref:probable receptor-like protein kinase At5g38990 n=1 Tax=Phaseolus vulgaris TaxID=3885 RepID=UPI0035C9DE80
MFLKYWGFCHSKGTSSRQYTTRIEELCHRFSLADIRKSTNNFDHEWLVDRLGFGVELYCGCLQHDGSDYTVIIKRFNKNVYERGEQWNLFKNEIELLCQLRHPNIISLTGFCNHKKEKIVVYEYMPNGSLHHHLQHGELSWKKRLEICIGAARGLHYLHAGAKRTIIHRDIKSRNILLDANMEPKLSDFGLSVQGQRFMSKPKQIKVDQVAGTYGHLAQEYVLNGIVTDKTDVYSFGIVLLEVVAGKYFDILEIEEFLKKPFEENIDLDIKGKIVQECWKVFIDIIHRCVNSEADERPTMGEVETQLEYALSLQEQADITNIHANYILLSKTIINIGVISYSILDWIVCNYKKQ